MCTHVRTDTDTHTPMSPGFISVTVKNIMAKTQQRIWKGLFGLQFKVIINHFGEIKARPWAAIHIISTLKNGINTSLLALCSPSPSLCCSEPSWLGNGTTHRGLSLPTSINKSPHPRHAHRPICSMQFLIKTLSPGNSHLCQIDG